jgi:hypothetical protein
MANIRALATIGLLVALRSTRSIAMPPQDVLAEVKSCKTIADDKERLKCLDGLFGGPSNPQKSQDEEQVTKPTEQSQANWSIDETKSPTDGSTEVVAANLVGHTGYREKPLSAGCRCCSSGLRCLIRQRT